MIRLTGWVLIAGLAVAGHAQVLNNQYLTGKYYFRQIAVGTDAKGGVVAPQSLSGTLTFDGAGAFNFGTYTVDPAGFVVMDSPLQKGNKLPGHIADLVRAMKPGIDGEMKQAGPDLEQRAVVANVRHNVKRLEQATPILADMVAKKKLRVVGAVYDLPTGKVALV